MARAKFPVSVAGIEVDALIDESRQLDAEIPQYTTEEGFQVSDAIIIDAETISMTLFVTDTPITWRDRHGGAHMGDVCSRLEAIYFNKEPITITTTDGNYTDMGIQSITFSKTFEVGYSREIPITFKKIRKTKTRTVEVSGVDYPGGGMTGQTAGVASTEGKNTEEPASIYYKAIDGLTGGALSDSGSGGRSGGGSTTFTSSSGRTYGGGSSTHTSSSGRSGGGGGGSFGSGPSINNNNTGGGYSPAKSLSQIQQVFN